MIWSILWPTRWFRAYRVSANRTPARRKASSARLAVEQLEVRETPAAVSYQTWTQTTFHVDDASVAQTVIPIGPTAQATMPQNASFGSMIGLPSVFTNYPYRGDNYSVAIIDTGIDYNNPNLGGGFGSGHRVIAGYDFANNDADPMDDNGHGTHVAGIIGSSNLTYSGIAPDVNLIALKVLDASGSGTFGNVQKALDWIVANRSKYNIVAVNLSLGYGNFTVNPYTFLDSDFANLTSGGVFISVAAGNSFYGNNSAVGLDYPAIDPYVVSVGAVYDGSFGQVAWASGARDYVTAPDLIASFSQRSSALSIMAPGAMITSTFLNNTFESMAGTSMAAPVIAGASVLMHQAMDTLHLTANETTILGVMQRTGVTIVDNATGAANVRPTGLTFKRLNLSAALNSLDPVSSAPLTLQPIANQTVSPGASRSIALVATGPNGAPTLSASIANGQASQAYQLKQQLGLTYAGSYYVNQWGQNEKWLTSTNNTWYCILPNGEFRRWAGSMSATLQPTSLLATLALADYTDPSLLWNAQSSAGPTVSVAGSVLTIQVPAGTAQGSYQIQVTASDGSATTSQTFTLNVETNSGVQIGSVAGFSMLNNRSQAVTMTAVDPQGNPITYSARVVGSYSTTPAALVIHGNQLTVYSAPDFTGGFDVQVTATAGRSSSSTTFHVNVTASPVAKRFTADFNGEGTQDTAFLNQDGSWWVSLKNADGSFVNTNWVNWSAASGFASVQVGDFNGDGKADVLAFTPAGYVYVGLSSGTSFVMSFWVQWNLASAFKSIMVGDFNGDGKADLLAVDQSGAIWVGISTGAAFRTQKGGQWSAAANWASISAADVDGDGKVDIIGLARTGAWYVGYSTGVSVRTQVWAGSSPPTTYVRS